MRRFPGLKRGRWFSLLVAGLIGYLLGGWHSAISVSDDLSASQNIALRFPEANEANADPAAVTAAIETPSAGTVSSSIALKEARLSLLSPQPMAPVVPASFPTAQPQQPSAALASLPAAEPPPLQPPHAATPAPVQTKLSAPPRAEVKAPTASAAAPSHTSRSGFMLNDAQIASIKERLHLTADQTRMWPAVEAALRNIAYAKERYAHRHNAPAAREVASLDPNGAEVQNLKSAAIPLIMSFSDEQKNEVRSLAHVMGLDKLAQEF